MTPLQQLVEREARALAALHDHFESGNKGVGFERLRLLNETRFSVMKALVDPRTEIETAAALMDGYVVFVEAEATRLTVYAPPSRRFTVVPPA